MIVTYGTRHGRGFFVKWLTLMHLANDWEEDFPSHPSECVWFVPGTVDPNV